MAAQFPARSGCRSRLGPEMQWMKTLFLIVAWCLLFVLLEAVLLLPVCIRGYRAGSVRRGA